MEGKEENALSEVELVMLDAQLKKTRSREKQKWLFVLLAVLLIAAAALAIWKYGNRNQGYEFDQTAINGILAGNDDDRLAILNEVVDKGMFNVKMNTTLVFLNGRSEGEVKIQNIPANHYYCMVSIFLDDGTTVYESKGLKPGQYIEGIKLSQDLAKGNYGGTAYFTVTDPETLRAIATLSADVSINVLN